MSNLCALAGNPNTGKSTVFNGLTGLRQHTGNWAGKTVVNAMGHFTYRDKNISLIDLPGTYSLLPKSPDEKAASDFINENQAEVYVLVLDATALERSLILALQVLSLDRKVILCLNLMDEAHKKHIDIDAAKLSSLLGAPVIKTSAKNKEGLERLKECIYQRLEEGKSKEGEIKKGFKPMLDPNASEEEKIEAYVNLASAYAKECVTQYKKLFIASRKSFDTIILNRKYGVFIMLAMLGLVFWLTIAGANYPSQLLSKGFGILGEQINSTLVGLSFPSLLRQLLMDGMYKTLTWVVSVMLPPMAIFFPLFTLMEDCGLLPRIAFNLDQYFKKAGCHGKQVLTMWIGNFG